MANGAPFWKPTFHERVRAKEAKRAAKRAQKRHEELERIRQDQEWRAQAYERDGGRCRATGVWLPLHHPSLMKVAHSHHVIWKSQAPGMPDGPHRRITICFKVHEMIHALKCLDVEGDPDHTVTFTERDPETGKVVRQWDSTV